MNDDPNPPFPQAGCCAQCHYFQPLDELNGHCHRYPPAYAGNSSPRESHHWRHPQVSGRAWCGEFLLRPRH